MSETKRIPPVARPGAILAAAATLYATRNRNTPELARIAREESVREAILLAQAIEANPESFNDN